MKAMKKPTSKRKVLNIAEECLILDGSWRRVLGVHDASGQNASGPRSSVFD
jgi:hypothetical protein